jgi:hypothetical protein
MYIFREAVHAVTESHFTTCFDVIPSPTDPMHVFLLMKDLRAATGIK